MKQCEGTGCNYKFEPKTANQRYADNSCRKTLDKDGICRVRRESRGPLWPVVNQGPAIRLPKPRSVAKKTAKYKKCVVVPDAQIGYYRGRDGKLEPTHDEKAIEIMLAIVRDVKPDSVVCVGDNLDFPTLGKYITTPAYQQTMQASIDRATTFCAQLREAAPSAKIVWLAGNHEERMPKYLLVNAVAAYGIRKGNTPDSWPVLTVPYLARMDDFGVEYRPGYPASDFWINEKNKKTMN